MTGVIGSFMDRLLAAVPGLRQESQQYLDSRRDHAAEGIEPPSAEGFLLKVVRVSEDWYLSGDPVLIGQLQALLSFLESELRADPESGELIEHYYAEYLPEPGDRAVGMLELLGPELRAARERQLLEDDLAVPDSTVDFLRRLAAAVPSLRERVAAHFERFNGKPLPHAFVGEIVFEAAGLVAAGRAALVRPLLGFLEAEYGVDEDIDNVIDVSFVEMLPDRGESGAEILDLLGPKLRAEYQRQRNWQN